MTRKVTCIECPVGCSLEVDIENCKVVKVSGNKCPKGIIYATEEVENPLRIITSTILTEGLELRTVSVRTDGPIPKSRIGDAMREIRKTRLKKPVRLGQIVIADILSLGVNVIATRSCR
jgi:CxxC motif-containing protein